MVLLILLLIIILYLIVNYYFHYSTKENFKSDNIIFLNKSDTINLLINDKDKYYSTFYYNDFKVRNIKNINEYKKIIIDSAINLNIGEKDKIRKIIEEINREIDDINLPYFNGKKFNNIIWKIGVLKDDYYEGGLPHTRSDTIILNLEQVKYYSSNKLKKTLFHEKVHIYQKKYKEDMDKYLNINNFKIVKKRNKYDNIRANPDLDEYIYMDKDFNTYKGIYNLNPISLEDVTYYPSNSQEYEHPYEKMAINLEKNII